MYELTNWKNSFLAWAVDHRLVVMVGELLEVFRDKVSIRGLRFPT